jgi:hypothetical protein
MKKLKVTINMKRTKTISNTNTKKTKVTYNTKGIKMIINMNTKNIKVLNKTKNIMVSWLSIWTLKHKGV